MGKKSGPPAPDYVGAAQKTADSSQGLATQDTYANRPTINTPWGNQTWSQNQSIDPSTGKPVTNWTQNISLSPDQQASADAQQRIQMGRSSAAEGLLGQVQQNFDQPMNWDSMPGRAENMPFGFGGNMNTNGPEGGPIQTSLNGNSSDYRQRAQDAVTELQRPDLEHRRSMLETQLANQGLTQGSEAYGNAMREQGDVENRAHLAAIGEGRNESNMMFGQDLAAGQFGNAAQAQGYGQDLAGMGFENNALMQQMGMGMDAGRFNNENRAGAIAEEAQRRGMSLNELNALLSGQQVGMPQMPTSARATMGQPTDYSGAANNQYQGALDAYNARMGANGQMAGAAGTAAMAAMMMFSDSQLKENITTIGLLPSGLRVVHYRYRGVPGIQQGVIAQEALQYCPEAVTIHPSGYLMVDYSKVK